MPQNAVGGAKGLDIKEHLNIAFQKLMEWIEYSYVLIQENVVSKKQILHELVFLHNEVLKVQNQFLRDFKLGQNIDCPKSNQNRGNAYE